VALPKLQPAQRLRQPGPSIQEIDTEDTLSPNPLPYEVINPPDTMLACGGMA